MLTLVQPAAQPSDAVGAWQRVRGLAVAGPVAAALDGDLGLVRIPLPSGASGGSVGRFGEARAIALSPNGRWLAAGMADRVARLHWPSGELDREDTVSSGVTALSIDDKGRRAAGCGDGRVWVDGTTGWGAYEAHDQRLVAVVRDGDRVVSADRTGKVVFVGLASGMGQTHPFPSMVGALLLVGPDTVLVGDEDGRLWRWRPAARALDPLTRVDAPITHITRVGDGLALAHGSVTTWSENDGVVGVLPAHRGDILGMGLAEDGRLWTASRGEGLRVHDPSEAGRRAPFLGHRAGVRALVAVDDGIWTAGRDGSVRFWTFDGRLQLTRRQGRAGVQRLLVLPDGKLAIGDTGGVLRRLRVDGRPDGAAVPAHEGPLTALGWLPGLKMIVTGGADGALRTWDPAALRPVFERHDHTNRLRCLLVLDDDVVVTGSYDNTIAVVPALPGPELARMVGHTRPVLGLAYLGGHLFSASLDGTLRRWDLDGTARGSVEVDTEGLVGLMVGGDAVLIAFGRDGVVSAWSVDLEPRGSVRLPAPGDGGLVHGDRLLVGDQRGGVHVLRLG